MAKKYRVKEKYVDGRYPHLRGVVFDEWDIDICQDVGSISMSIEQALEFEQMSYQEQREYIVNGVELDGQIISVSGYSNDDDVDDYTEFDGIYEFEEVEDDNV
jgi:hypothetical protein